ncbi:hypothetical protein F2P81_011914 [Scophthalmus maximus]|uniref:Reverse transcriptase domain-containing protein n=1 Tax=Scophthalmus maximus TaxID=52904 RepID=A0A6A4T355_SCOMX|nr:hypothetical protein F2P81_011914 [Scophthalmus maximus]
MLLQSRSNYYEYGDKGGRLLAHQLKRQAFSRLITQIKDPLGALLSAPSDINVTFKTSALYQSNSQTDNTTMDRFFFFNPDVPAIDPAMGLNLDSPLVLQEIVDAISSMQSNKAPGPDGYPTEFFKKFSSELAPLLLDVYSESIKRGTLPPTLTQASISLLLKKDKDPTCCGSYRPLSLLNVDVKVLAKALATRLEAVLPDIVSKEQTGFMKGRHSFFDIRTLMNIIYSTPTSRLPEVVISLDTEKAFDRVEWLYLFTVLKKCGSGDRFSS